MTTDETAARLGEMLEKAKIAIENKTGYGGRSFSAYYKSRLIGLVIPPGKDVRVEHVMALVDITEALPALLAEREAMRAELTALRAAQANALAIIGNVEHRGGGSNSAKMYADMLNDIRDCLAQPLPPGDGQ